MLSSFVNSLPVFKKNILIPDSVKKQLGSGFRRLVWSGFNDYGSVTRDYPPPCVFYRWWAGSGRGATTRWCPPVWGRRDSTLGRWISSSSTMPPALLSDSVRHSPHQCCGAGADFFFVGAESRSPLFKAPAHEKPCSCVKHDLRVIYWRKYDPKKTRINI